MNSCLNDESDPEDRLSPRPVLARYVKKFMLIFSKLHRAAENIISHLFDIFFFVFSVCNRTPEEVLAAKGVKPTLSPNLNTLALVEVIPHPLLILGRKLTRMSS